MWICNFSCTTTNRPRHLLAALQFPKGIACISETVESRAKTVHKMMHHKTIFYEPTTLLWSTIFLTICVDPDSRKSMPCCW